MTSRLLSPRFVKPHFWELVFSSTHAPHQVLHHREAMATAAKTLLRVAAVEKGRLPWCIPLDVSSRVAQLASAVQDRENRLRTQAKKPCISVGIQLKVDGDLCAVDPEDLLTDLATGNNEGMMFVAVQIESSGPGSSCNATAAAGGAAGTMSSTRARCSRTSSEGAPSNSPASFSTCSTVPAGTMTSTAVAAPGGGGSEADGTSKVSIRLGTLHNTMKTSRQDGGGAAVVLSVERRLSRPKLSRSTLPPGPCPVPDSPRAPVKPSGQKVPEKYPGAPTIKQRTQARAKKARVTHHSRLLPRASLASRWKAAETLVLTAAMLHGTSDDRDEAYAFVVELAGGAEAGRRLCQKVKSAASMVDGKGIFVQRTGIITLCKTRQAPDGYGCLTRYLLGDSRPGNKEQSGLTDAQEIATCFHTLVKNIPNGSAKPLERWWFGDERAARFKWTR